MFSSELTNYELWIINYELWITIKENDAANLVKISSKTKQVA
jgi:hypothetical protein